LRGCIGSLAKDKNLIEAVQDLTVKSAFSDSRFTDLKEEELKDIEIEISILSDLTEIKKIEEIEVGQHGLFVQKESFSGLLLPQVADEEQWDREMFLKNTCLKAGLDGNAWKKGARVFKFSALKFSEEGTADIDKS
jgi:AmmeMemoRadiSam system protein A